MGGCRVNCKLGCRVAISEGEQLSIEAQLSDFALKAIMWVWIIIFVTILN